MNPCLILPTFNDSSTIKNVVSKLLRYSLPIIIVNDGSDTLTRDSVDAVVDGNNLVTCIHRACNGGKGAAVMDGLQEAKARGFSHAIQLDADDQHSVDDVQLFLNVAQNDPNKFVLGTPIFSLDVPRKRLIGRKISVFWVALETLSFRIKDPLFGFRLYPVAQTLGAVGHLKLGMRMDFDPEIAVRLYWSGMQVVNIPTPVRYPEGGRSSFRMFRDNVRISWMHTRLFCGMVFRIPRLVKWWFRK